MSSLNEVDALLDSSLAAKQAEPDKSAPAPKPDDANGGAAADGDKPVANGDSSPSKETNDEEERPREVTRRSSRSRSRSRSRSPAPRGRRSRSRSRSPRRRRGSRRSRSPRRRSRSPHRRRRSRSPRRRRRSRSPYRRERSRRSRSPSPRRRSPSPRRRSPSPRRARSPQLTPQERDQRTVVCMQLNRKCRAKDLAMFLEEHAGPVKSCKMIKDRKTGISKGVAYAEFIDVQTVPKALSLTGQRLLGAPIVILVSQAEKNRLAEEKAKQEQLALTKLAVENLPEALTDDDDLRAIFREFGRLKECTLAKSPEGESLRYGHVVFEFPKDAQEALVGLNGYELLGSTLRVSLAASMNPIAPPPGVQALPPMQMGLQNMQMQMQMPMPVPVQMPSMDLGRIDNDLSERGGITMTAQGRADLMKRLAESRAGVKVPSDTPQPTPAAPPAPVAPAPSTPAIYTCLKLSNMFDASQEEGSSWVDEVTQEVLQEMKNFGAVYHIKLEPESNGEVYMRFASAAEAAKAQTVNNGRLFGGQKIVGQLLTLEEYAKRYPEARAMTTPL
eukprot:m.30019 g.30019  ORF g.30019 m.30019 type:complete len:558 (-) comp9230_c0_seq2:1138-2811(-)